MSTKDASTERASTERASTERASTEPASTEPASTEPASTEPASTDDAEVGLAPAWIAWATENLLAGAPTKAILDAWVRAGVPEALATQTLDALRRSPIFVGARAVGARAARAEQLVRIARERSRTLRIESREGLDADTFFGTYVAGNLPVSIPDFARDWRAIGTWDLDYFERTVPDAPIAIADGRDALPVHERNAGRAPKQVTVRELVARIRSAGETDDFYAIAQDRNLMRPELAPLLGDLDLSRGFLDPAKVASSTALWLGPAGTITPWHHDTSSIVFVQVWGRKRLRLVAPSELAMLEGARAMYAGVDEPPSDVTVHELELGPGDAVFLPVGWWHHVRALTPSISLAFNGLARGPNAFAWYCPGAVR